MRAFSPLHAHGMALAVAFVVASIIPGTNSFQPQASVIMLRRWTLSSPLHAVVDPPLPPGYAEEEKDKKKKQNEDSPSNSNNDWTESTRGGFIPNILRRSRQPRPKHGRDVVLRVESIQDYKAVVVDEKEHITVVRFFAPWCKSCRAAEPLFYKLAAEYFPQNVKFVEVPLNKRNSVLHEALGVPSLPWIHIYHPEAGLVEERKVSKKHVEDVGKCLRCYVYGECDLEDEPSKWE